MRFLVWTWRVILVVVAAAFVATIYYMTHDVGTSMDGAMPALNLITVIGTGLLGIIWSIARRYWHALMLLVTLGLFRGLFWYGHTELLTDFQKLWLLVSIGVVVVAFVVTLTARALANDRALKAVRAASAVPAAPAVAVAPAPIASASETAVTVEMPQVTEAAPAVAEEPNPTKE